MAIARNTDPWTSHEAAESVRVTENKQMVLDALVRPMTDEELVAEINKFVARQSPSGIRSRRAELARDGFIVPVSFSVTASGRKAIVWEKA